MRGLAALLVFVHHIRLLFYKDAFEAMDDTVISWHLPAFLQDFIIQLKNTFVDGTLFVWVFWILSAYVLSIRLFRPGKENKPVLYLSFLKRYLRLFIPITVSVLLVLLFIRVGWFYNKEAARELVTINQDPAWLNSFFNFDFGLAKVLNFLFFEVYFNYNFDQTFNPVLWSIQNEFIGSLFIFALFGIVGKYAGRLYVYLLLIPVLIYLGLFELFPFLIGYALCDLDFSENHHRFFERMKRLEKQLFARKWLTLLLFFVLLAGSKVLWIWFGAPNHVIYMTQSFVILYFSLRNELFVRFLSLKWVYGFGSLSFSFYLLHMIVICSFSSYLMLIDLGGGFKIVIVVLTFIISLLISIPFYLFIDKFAIRFSNSFAYLVAKSDT
ncbi:MAG: acyltransferase 3 [Crocinitomicaceae bacterium]|nr:acyltransferase 3 [Crocinitomicaceae bacterium]